MNKRFAISSNQIKRLVPNMGGCFITDRVTVDGLKIGYLAIYFDDEDDLELARQIWRSLDETRVG